ncbi:MAG TPA: lysophospholipase [bacterium]|nr:lysophospholipase [bacterium]
MKREDYFENKGGGRFRYVEHEVEGARAVVMGTHGFAEHIGRYDHVGAFFNSRGMSFYMMDNRGHGKSPGARGHIDSYDQYVDDLHGFRTLVVEEKLRGAPLFLLGHSNGSLITARYCLKHAAGVRGVVLSGILARMAMKVNPLKLKTGMLLSKIVPKLAIPGEISPSDVCRDKEVVREYENDPLVFKVNTLGFAAQLIWAMEDLNKRAGEFKPPVLFQHGGDDRLCSPEGARAFHDNIASTDKQFILYPGLYHEIYNEFEKDEILAAAADWIDKRL